MKHETFREAFSMIINWCLGGSLKEMYCSRCWREKRLRNIYLLNWLYFIFSGYKDTNHCKRVHEDGEK